MAKTGTGPGRSHRDGITIIEAVHQFGTPEQAERWLIEQRWPDGVRCAYCGHDDIAMWKRPNSSLKWWRCKKRQGGCGKRFSVKTDSVMQQSKLSLDKWCMAIFLSTTSLKGVSSMKLHRDLGITQKSAWHLGQRIRKSFEDAQKDKMQGPAEIDETYIGGSAKNKHQFKREHIGGGPKGKDVLMGIKDREKNQIRAEHIPDNRGTTIKPFITANTTQDATVYSDDSSAYSGLRRAHEVVNHSIGEYVRGMAHTNGIESFWAMLKRGYAGTFHHFSAKHLQRYVDEFAGRHNIRLLDTLDQMKALARAGVGKQLTHQELIRPMHRQQPALLKGC